MNRKRLLSSAVLVALLAAAPQARADEPETRPDTAEFGDHYTDGRERLVAGDFAGAAAAFQAARDAAADPTNRALAETQRALAAEWVWRGVTLVSRAKAGENATARALDVRSSDEIVSLYANAALYGIGTGIWVSTTAGASSTTAEVLPALGFAGLAVGGVVVADHGRGLRYGVAQSLVSGMYIGLEEGITLGLWRSSVSNVSGPVEATVIWTGATAGVLGGAIVSSVVPTTPGRSAFVGSTALWGSVLAGMTTGAVSTAGNSEAPLFASAVGVGAGTITGLLTAGMVSPSISHVRFLDLGGIGGLLVGGGIYLVASGGNPDARVMAASAGVGTASGLALVWFLTSSMAKDDLAPRAAPATTGIVWNPTVIPAKGGGMLGVVGQM